MKKMAIVIMLLTIVSKMLGFFREIILAYYYGASNVSDAFIISQNIPGMIFSFIGAGIVTAFIPIYTNIITNHNNNLADKFTSNLINFVLLLCSFIVIICIIFAEQLVYLFASGFDEETIRLTATFTRITVFGIYFTGLVYIFNAYLNIKNNFIVPALIGIPLNLVMILSIMISYNNNIYIMAYGSVIALIFQFLLTVPFVYKNNFKYKPILDFNDSNLRKMMVLAVPVIIGASVNQINALVDKTVASRIIEGGISALSYAYTLTYFIQGVFVLSIATIMYPLISKMVSENNLVGLKRTFSDVIGGINLLIIPISFGAMLFAEPIVKLLFGRGEFDSQAIYLTSNALFFYAIGMMGYAYREVVSRVFYSLGDTKTPMINATIAIILNIILIIILSKFMGLSGLALATSISGIVGAILLTLNLGKKIGSLNLKSTNYSLLKIVISSVIMVLVCKYSFLGLLLIINETFSLFISIIIGTLLYLLLILLFRVNEVKFIKTLILKKIKSPHH